QGNPIEIFRKNSGLYIVMAAFGWWASITWERYANTLENSRLTIRKWDGHPPFPRTVLIRQPTCVNVDQYTFGLGDQTRAAWLRVDRPDRHASSSQIVMDILQDFMSNPLNPAVSWFSSRT